MSLIIAEKLSKKYVKGEIQVQALKGLDFKIEPAAFVSFVGPSGSGKTTLLNLIGCLDKPTSGILNVADKNVSHLDRRMPPLLEVKPLVSYFRILTFFLCLQYMKMLSTHYL